MKIVSEHSGFKLELTIPDELRKRVMSDEVADRLINEAYKPFIDKITVFLACCIGSQDFNSIEAINHTIVSIAENKLKNR